MRGAFFFHHLLVLGQSYLELKADGPSYPFGAEEQLLAPMPPPNNDSFCYIQAQLPRRGGEVNIAISQEDYERIAAIASPWRVSSSGYVVSGKRVNGKNTVRYLHKEIFGDTCTHINGDRLDNRRSNLASSKKRRRSAEENLTDFVDSESPLGINSLNTDPVTYPDGKEYFGDYYENMPHGFGMLVESKKRSLGWWWNGKFHSGIVMHLVPVPERMLDAVQVYHPVERAVLVHNNKLVNVFEN
jgi:hypothetical protein